MRNHPPGESLLIVGASPRAAAQSARRAGLRPVCIAKFEDEDLTAMAHTLAWPKDLKELIRLAESLPPGPWMYTGAMENHPALIDAVSRTRRLWGNPGAVVRAVRDPTEVAQVLRERGLPALDVRPASSPPEDDGDWLLKPTKGGGGIGITPWRGAGVGRRPRRAVYFQRRVAGASLAAVFLADGHDAHLSGLTWQLVGLRTSHAPRFAYCGSIGPVLAAEERPKAEARSRSLEAANSLEATIPAETYRQIERLGRAIARAFELRGLFGCDLVWDGRCVWLTEVNPRYTASVEVLEHAFRRSLLELHRRVFEGDGQAEIGESEPPASAPRKPLGMARTNADWFTESARRFVGKQILYAPRSLVTPPLAGPPAAEPKEGERSEALDALPPLADVPAPGTRIPAGHPICTVLAQAATLPACWDRLREQVEAVRGRVMGER